MEILSTQHDIEVQTKAIIKRYALKHSYCSDENFNIPSYWIDIEKLIQSKELKEFNENDITSVINELTENEQLIINRSSTKIRFNKL